MAALKILLWCLNLEYFPLVLIKQPQKAAKSFFEKHFFLDFFFLEFFLNITRQFRMRLQNKNSINVNIFEEISQAESLRLIIALVSLGALEQNFQVLQTFLRTWFPLS